MLLTTRNLLVSRPAASSSGKYFWLAFMVRIRHSCGTSRNRFLELTHQHVGALDQRGHLVEQGLVLDGDQRRPASAAAASWRIDPGLALGEGAITAPSVSSVAA